MQATIENKLEIATRLVDELKKYSGEKGRVWQSGDLTRVYLRKGFVSITEEGKVDVKTVGGIAFSQGVALRAKEAGLSNGSPNVFCGP